MGFTMQRLDKLVAKIQLISRKEAKELIRSGQVRLHGQVCTDCGAQINDTDELQIGGESKQYTPFVYIMLHKPAGVISASAGKRGETTVIDLLPKSARRPGLFPAGRLDKATTGFCLLTDDGAFAHRILSPKSHVEKTYLALLDKPFDDSTVRDFESGMLLNGQTLLQAELTPCPDNLHPKIVLRQGLYHQVRRMFAKHGMTVLELKRTKIGPVALDETLQPGQWRNMTEKEVAALNEAVQTMRK